MERCAAGGNDDRDNSDESDSISRVAASLLGRRITYTSEMVLEFGQSDGRFCDEHNARNDPTSAEYSSSFREAHKL